MRPESRRINGKQLRDRHGGPGAVACGVLSSVHPSISSQGGWGFFCPFPKKTNYI